MPLLGLVVVEDSPTEAPAESVVVVVAVVVVVKIEVVVVEADVGAVDASAGSWSVVVDPFDGAALPGLRTTSATTDAPAAPIIANTCRLVTSAIGTMLDTHRRRGGGVKNVEVGQNCPNDQAIAVRDQ